MNTPICDFVAKYANDNKVRLHMPGHKGIGGEQERLDITEIVGADSLYEANGIIRESERNASELFSANTYYSTEGSSLAIRAMIYLVSQYAKEHGKAPLIAAGRNAHKVLVSALALLDLDVDWLTSREDTYLSCTLDGNDVREYLERADVVPAAIYITSPDYLGNISDIREIAAECKKKDVLLVVDNAHGAYLNFLNESMHPIALGADMCCDSAHKTLPVLTGGAYLHISKKHSDLAEKAKTALSLFGSTSPSYLILASLDRANKYLSDGYREKLERFITRLNKAKNILADAGYELLSGEPMKITIAPKSYGYTGIETADYLASLGIVTEFSDLDYTVLMPTPENLATDIDKLVNALTSLNRKEAIKNTSPKLKLGKKVLTIREAALSQYEILPINKCENRILSSVTVGCPPAVPILVSGELIDKDAIKCFEYYGITECSVVKEK